MNFNPTLAGFGVAAVATIGALPTSATAQVDFSGERIEVLVPYTAGGGTDIYARFLAPLLAKHLPGNPTITINNVPGAGALAGMNQFQNRADPDGTDIAGIGASAALNFAFRHPQVNYELDEWQAFLSTPVGTVVYARSDLGVDSAEDITELQDQSLLMGANNATGGDLRALLSLGLLGIEVDPVFGMNRGDIYSAFERGEFNINFDTVTAYEAQVVPMVEEGTAVPLFTLGFIDENGEYGRDPSQPDLPSFLEVYEQVHGEPLSGEAYDAWMAIFGLNVMASRAVLLPEGASQEVYDTYVQATRDVMAEIEADPDLSAQAFEILGPGPHAVGESANRILRNALSFDDAAFEWLGAWLKDNLDTDLSSSN